MAEDRRQRSEDRRPRSEVRGPAVAEAMARRQMSEGGLVEKSMIEKLKD